MKKNLKTRQQLLIELEHLQTMLDARERLLREANEILRSKIADSSKLHESFLQQHAKNIVETIPTPLVVLAADLTVISANQSFYSTFQVMPQETEGRFIYKLGNRQWDIPALRKLLDEIVPLNSHFDNVEVDHSFPAIGRKKMVLNARRIYREGKGMDMILLAIDDITERKEIEEALIASETRYRRLFETTRDGILILDAGTGQVSDVNPFILEMLGYHSCEDFSGKKFWELGILKDAAMAKKIFSELQSKGYAHYKELSLETKDGRLMVVEFIGNAYLVNLHKVIQCNFRDITERKVITDALQKAHDDMERRVEDRTAELRAALSEIGTLKDQLEAERAYLQEEIKLEYNYENIIGQSNEIHYVFYKIEQIAATDTNVLILGETGTGKELVARAIHNLSLRKDRSLVKINCATLPSDLIESELFGHEKGAFTSANTKQLGRFEVADGTTLFLDEIGELPLELQPKLLRVIQDGEFERLGSSHTIKVDVRIIAATNRNLEEEVRNRRFREDLWYRLNVFPITIPPLRDRLEDIPLLVDYYVKKICKKLGKSIENIPASAMDALQSYHWPGNIRELENVLARAVISSSGPKLRLVDELKKSKSDLPGALKTLQDFEREYIMRILEQTQWKVSGEKGAAAILGLNRSTLRARMRKLGIRKP